MDLPYLTADAPGIGGVIKQHVEDFFVQEIPLYEPAGTGEHVYCEIQKVGLTTFDAVNRFARALNISPHAIGYAGMKDARAVTRQVFSIQGTTEAAVMALTIPGVTINWTIRHGNKLRLGHLAGNRFAVKIRDVAPTDVVKVRPVMSVLEKRGMPNYFGEQRFGRRENNHLLGAALVRGDDEALLALLLGTPDPAFDDAQAMGARKAFDRNDFAQAMRLFPRRSGMERRILHRLIRTENPTAAVRAIDEKLRRLWVSAIQSELFNEVVSRRIGAIDQVMNGDLAWKHDNGACFLVEDAATEQARCAAFAISASGPLVGYRVTLPEGEPLRIEQEVMKVYELAPENFRVEGRLKVKGARRPLRVQPKDVDMAGGVDERGPHVTVAFTLPPGSFATVLLRELMKSDQTQEAEADAPASGDQAEE